MNSGKYLYKMKKPEKRPILTKKVKIYSMIRRHTSILI